MSTITAIYELSNRYSCFSSTYFVPELHRRLRQYIFLRLRCAGLVFHTILTSFCDICDPLVPIESNNKLLGPNIKQLSDIREGGVHQLTGYGIITARGILYR